MFQYRLVQELLASRAYLCIMTEAQQTHPEFEKWEEMLENLNVWNKPSAMEEATTRRSIEVEVIENTFTDGTDIKYGRNVDEKDISPGIFQSTDRVEIERVQSDELGKTYRLSARLTNLNPDPQSRLTLHFEGYVSEQNGFETKHPVIIRKG
jgi:hypothetical protein